MSFKAMYMRDSRKVSVFASIVLGILSIGCAPDPAVYQYGISLADISFQFFDITEGAHPSRTTLSNPNNPFSEAIPSKWEVESAGYPQASFYSWASVLAFEPTGEHQFYTALALHNIYTQELCTREEAYFVHAMAVQAYQTQLDMFPYSLSYTADGTPFPLDILAYDAIISLGGTVENWIKSVDSTGEEILIPKEGL